MAAVIHEGSALPLPVPAPVPLGQLLPWALFGTVLALMVLYFVGAEQGATSLISGAGVHELVHDARHLLTFPCH